jgi:hypothetical protein
VWNAVNLHGPARRPAVQVSRKTESRPPELLAGCVCCCEAMVIVTSPPDVLLTVRA